MNKIVQNTITINSLSELESNIPALVKALGTHKVIAFYAPMGAGKTTIIKALCKALGVQDTISSPTFSIINEYHSKLVGKIYHFDFYRIKSINEAFDMGYEDYVYSNNYCFIEWPERIEELLPEDCLKVTITVADEKRMVSFGI